VVAATPSSAPVQATTRTTAPAPTCALPVELPFEPSLPTGWTRTPYQRSGSAYVPQVWWSPKGGPIEIWNGGRPDGVPEPHSPPETITVLGVPAGIGPISDGYSAVFQLGPTRCDRWALVAHPGVMLDELRTIALGLRLATTKVYSWRPALTVVGNATTADPTSTAGSECATVAGGRFELIDGVETETIGVAPLGTRVLVAVCTSTSSVGPVDAVTVIDPSSGDTLQQFTDRSALVVPLAAFGAATVTPTQVREADTVTVTPLAAIASLCGDLATVFRITSTGLGGGGLLDPTGGWKDDRSRPTVDKDCTPAARALPRSYIVPAELVPGEYLVCIGVDTIPEACGRFTVSA
jgi:hypothetical protein